MKRLSRILFPVFLAVWLAFGQMPAVKAEQTELPNAATMEESKGAAYTMELNREYTTSLEKPEGYLSFVTPAEEGYIHVALSNATMDGAQRFELLDAAGKEIISSSADRSAARYWNMKCEPEYRNKAMLEPNTRYYIHIGDADSKLTGKARFEVRFAKDEAPNGIDGAVVIEANKDYTGTLDSETARDTDCYKFVPTATDTYKLTVNNLGTANEVAFHIKDRNGNNVTTSSYGYIRPGENAVGTYTMEFQSGTIYYISIEGNIGKYSFRLSNQKVETIKIPASITLKDTWDSYDFLPEVLPETAFNKEVAYESSNTDVVMVAANGRVRPMSSGKAVITVKATDGGGASAKCTVYVKPDAPGYVKGTKSTKDSITIMWDSVKSATSYTVYQKNGSKWKKLGNTSKTTYKIKKLTSAKGYQFRVVTNMKVDGKTFTSPNSKVCYSATTPTATSITKFTKMGKKKVGTSTYYGVKISWKKIKNVKKYSIYGKLPASNRFDYIDTYKGSSGVVYLETYQVSRMPLGRLSQASFKCQFYVVPVFTYKDESYYGPKSKTKAYTFR